jgi:hypothetical protein
VVEAVLEAAPEVEAPVSVEPEPAGPAGHGTIRLRTAAPVAVVEAVLEASSEVEATVVPASAPAPAAPQASGEIQRLEAEAKAASQAAYEAYHPPHGQRPAANAGELLAKASAAAAALAAAKGA